MTTSLAPAQAEQSVWRPIVMAMGKTGGGSVVSGLLSALGTKIVAAMLGPDSIALLQTLQQLRDGAVIAATSNGRAALVQGASALEGVKRREYLRSGALLFAGAAFLVSLAILMAPAMVVRWSRLPPSAEPLLPWLAVTVALLTIFVFLTAILNSLGKIGRLALLQMIYPAASAILAWPLACQVRHGHRVALIMLLAIPAAQAVLVTALVMRGQHLSESFRGPGLWFSVSAARGFFSIAGAMLLSGLAATAVLLAVRGSITRQEGLPITGQFDAAWNISMNQVTLILGSVQAYYLPTLAATKNAAERRKQIRSMLMAATLATVPVIVALAALRPFAVSLLYSSQFASSPQFLRWTLVGDYLKVSAWVLATPMLATREVGAFLASDMLTHLIFLGSALLLARVVRPAEGAAIGFLLSYAAYFSFCYGYARARHGFRLGAKGRALWLIGLALIVGASANCWSDDAAHLARASFWILLAFGFSAGFALFLRRREA